MHDQSSGFMVTTMSVSKQMSTQCSEIQPPSGGITPILRRQSSATGGIGGSG
jgi:hypothetical protein